MAAPKFSVIIPTIGRTQSLSRIVSDLISSESPSIELEIIVVQDGPPVAPRFTETIRELPVLFLSSSRGRREGAAQARNLGALQASGDYLVFMDDDIELSDSWHEELVDSARQGLQAWTGPITGSTSTLLAAGREARYAARYSGLRPGQSVDFLPGGNSVVRSDLFINAGGFPNLRTGSDNALAKRLRLQGVHVRYVPRFLVSHHHDRGWRVASRAAYESGLMSTPEELRRDLLVSVRMGPFAARLVNCVLATVKIVGFLVAQAGR